ncbi:MAG: lactate utilization protein [Lachnospiraceae bacterium]|nr:lactate utilization protein [Lachnospiraceae bacterium]
MTPKQIAYENLANTMIKNMEKRRMEGYYCHTREEAVKKVLELIPEGSSIGWGGSVTLTETGVMDALNQGNYRMIDRMAGKTPEEVKKINAEIFGSDYFLMSTNAITMDGELINIDGRANRVSYLCFGPENVIIVAGMNKVVHSVEAGIARTHNVAAPPNTVRLNRNTPCAKTGKCGDCYSPDCICGQVVITRLSMVPNRIKVVLVGEELGF